MQKERLMNCQNNFKYLKKKQFHLQSQGVN